MDIASETIIRFAGHDLTLNGDRTNINVIARTIEAIEKQPEHMTDIFNLSSDSNEFYKFESTGLTIQGEKHFLSAIHKQLLSSPQKVTNLPLDIHDIIYQMACCLDTTSPNHDPNFAAQHRISAKKAAHCKIYRFAEHSLVIQGEKQHITELAQTLRSIEQSKGELSTTVSDLVYQIEYAFDIDGIRSEDTEIPFDPDFADQYLI